MNAGGGMSGVRADRRARAWWRRVPALLAALLLGAGTVPAQADRVLATDRPALAGIDWSRRPVLLVTMGQGDQVFEKFGHNAIAVWDEARGEPVAYNYGTFDFNQPNFLLRFLTGDTKYWLTVERFETMLAQYQYLNRTLVVQELALTPAQRDALVAALAENAQEANRYYRYDYYRDNCSTRVRDMLDRVTAGALAQGMRSQPGEGSYRWHTRRALAYSLPLYFGAQLVLGVDADQPLSRWDEAFLPRVLAESVRRVQLPADGGLPARALVAREDTLLVAQRAAEPMTVPPKLPLAMLLGAALAGVVWLLGALRGRRTTATVVLGWSLLSTLLGVILLLAWFATRHLFMRNNPSVALMHPGWLVGAVVAIAIWRSRVSRRAVQALSTLLLLGVVGAALAGHGSALELGALLLPPHAAVAALARRARGTA